MTLERSYIGFLGFLVIDFLKSVLMYSKGAICLSKLLFKMGLFTVYIEDIFSYLLFFLIFIVWGIWTWRYHSLFQCTKVMYTKIVV
jgi:hypothetical protein